MILYGPAGIGKTTLAKIIAGTTSDSFEQINATVAGVAELRQLVNKAKSLRQTYNKRMILFIDEIHRFNKLQQDVLLPFVENGLLVLIGATTENPYFEVNSPLLSRAKVVRLEPLSSADIHKIITSAMTDSVRGLGGSGFGLTEEAKVVLANMAGGDARAALNLLEQVFLMFGDNTTVDITMLTECMPEAIRKYDKSGDEHYNVISAFIKSMRGSDANAALHYLARMIDAGESPTFIARRIVICASEDVGLADPQALVLATAAMQAVHMVGMPEARIILSQAVCYIAKAPKSNAAYVAIDKALSDVRMLDCGDVPNHLKDSHYAGAAKMGLGVGYIYPHDYPEGSVKQQYLPDKLIGKTYLN